MSHIVHCLYNSYSFTTENINGDGIIVYYDIQQSEPVRNKEVPVLPEPLFVMTNDAHAADTDTDTDTSSSVGHDDDDSSSDTTTNTHDDDGNDHSDKHKNNTKEQFHPDAMKPYAYGNTDKSRNETMKMDSLLWSIYIMIYGVEKYETIENHYTESNRFKFELIELLRQNKTNLKANKLKLSVIEESLVHKPFITLETLHGIAVCKSLSIYVVQGRKYYDTINGGSIMPFIIEKVNGHFILYMAPPPMTMNYIAFIRASYWRMESISAPIRPISAYKLQDLIDISMKLGLPVATIIPGKFGSMGTEKRKTKPELYEGICRCL